MCFFILFAVRDHTKIQEIDQVVLNNHIMNLTYNVNDQLILWHRKTTFVSNQKLILNKLLCYCLSTLAFAGIKPEAANAMEMR